MNETREPRANLPPPPFLPRTSLPGSRTVALDQEDRNPLLHGLVWALVAIGVLGLGIWGVEKHFFNNGDDKPAQISESKPAPTPPQTPTSVPPVKERPRSMPPPAPPPQPSGDHSVEFVTAPPGATVIVDVLSDLSCRTPCMMTL